MPWVPDVALVHAKAGVADDVWYSPIVYANVYKPSAGTVIAGDLYVQQTTTLVDAGDRAHISSLHADLGYVFMDGKDSIMIPFYLLVPTMG